MLLIRMILINVLKPRFCQLKYVLVLLGITLISSSINAQQIENLVFRQEGVNIIVTYDLIGNTENIYAITVFSSHNNFSTPIKLVTGDAGAEISPGTRKMVTWDARRELGEYKGNLRIRIHAKLIPIIEFENVSSVENATLISFGYGNSYGGLGVDLGTNISSKVTLHIGVGWFPLSIVYDGADDMFLIAGGARIFFSELNIRSRAYLDVQFGMLGGEYNETSLYIGGSLVSQTKKQQALYGPSILLGIEGFWGQGNIGGRIAGGVSYNLAEIEWTDDFKFLGALDIGLVFRL